MHYVIAKGLLSAINGMNIYRGCTHGCIYCDSRSLCYQMNHAFEDIEVKQNAPQLLEDRLSRKRKPCMISTGSMSDPYMHCEAELKLTRQCLEIIDRYGFGAAVLTKSDLILRDMDILDSINRRSKAVVQMTLTTYDEQLCGILEPNVCTTKRRFEVLRTFRDAGIPTVVWLSPILPFINDTEENLRGILDYCFEAEVKGIICFDFGTTMRDGSREYFYRSLDRHFPAMKQRYIERYGSAYECSSDNNDRLMDILRTECEAHSVMYEYQKVFDYLHEYPDSGSQQLSLFG